MSVSDQIRAFLAMALCGAGVGAAHDLLAPFRRRPISAAAADLALGLMLAAGVIGTALVLRCEPMRLYTLLGVAAGWALYAASLGTIVRALTRFFMNMSKKVVNCEENRIYMQE